MSNPTRQIADLFDSVASNYDENAFFQISASKLLGHLPPDLGGAMLDICCGTGAIAINAAQRYRQLRIRGIDISAGMLKIARNKARQLNLENVSFSESDVLAALEAKDSYDLITGGYALFFLPELPTTLRKLRAKLNPGGIFAFSTFTGDAFQPYVDLFLTSLEAYQIQLPEMPYKLQNETEIEDLCQNAGISSPRMIREDIRYPIDIDGWWRLLNSAGYKGLLSQVPQDQMAEFKRAHLAAVAEHSEGNKIMLNADSIYSFVEGAL